MIIDICATLNSLPLLELLKWSGRKRFQEFDLVVKSNMGWFCGFSGFNEASWAIY